MATMPLAIAPGSTASITIEVAAAIVHVASGQRVEDGANLRAVDAVGGHDDLTDRRPAAIASPTRWAPSSSRTSSSSPRATSRKRATRAFRRVVMVCISVVHGRVQISTIDLSRMPMHTGPLIAR